MRINIAAADEEKFIYRITSLEHLIEMFSINTNILVKPHKWDDPYENLILRSKVRHTNGDIRQYNYHERLYGQCWTLHKASDAMWRIYAKDKKGIRLRTTIRILASSLENAHTAHTDARCCIGRVEYLPSKIMRTLADSTFDDSGITVDKMFRSLLVKRPAFRHEKEIRILYYDLNDHAYTKDIYSYSVDPHILISQIMIDPRLTAKEAQQLASEIRDRTGYRGTIKRSLLYTPPHGLTVNVAEQLVP